MQIRAQFKARPRPNHCSPRPITSRKMGPWVRAHIGSRTHGVATALCCGPLGLLSRDPGLHCPAVTRVGECLCHGFCGEDRRAPGGGHCSRAPPQTAGKWLCPVQAGRPLQVKKTETDQEPSSPSPWFLQSDQNGLPLRSALPLLPALGSAQRGIQRGRSAPAAAPGPAGRLSCEWSRLV